MEVNFAVCRAVLGEQGNANAVLTQALMVALFSQQGTTFNAQQYTNMARLSVMEAAPQNALDMDDDGNRPVTTLRKKGKTMRLLVGSATGASDLRIAPAAAGRLGVAVPGTLADLRWGILPLAPISAAPEEVDRSDRAEDGRLGFGFLGRYHAHVDMRHRWIYVREIAP